MQPLTPSLLPEAATDWDKERTGPILEVMSSRGRLWLCCIQSFSIITYPALWVRRCLGCLRGMGYFLWLWNCTRHKTVAQITFLVIISTTNNPAMPLLIITFYITTFWNDFQEIANHSFGHEVLTVYNNKSIMMFCWQISKTSWQIIAITQLFTRDSQYLFFQDW